MLGGVVLAGAFLRFYHIGAESLWYDEATSVYSAEKSLRVLLGGALQWHRQPPLYFLLLKVWIGFFGDSESAVRSLSAVCGIAAIPLMFLVGRKLFNNRVGLIAAWLTAISYYLIRFSQEGRDYSLLVLLTLASFYLFLRILKSGKAGKADFIWYAAANTLLLYTHYFGLFVLLAQGIYYLLVRKQAALNARYLRNSLIASGLAFLPWAIGVVLVSIPNSAGMGRPGAAALFSTLRDYSGYGQPGVWILLTLACLILAGLIQTVKRHPLEQATANAWRFGGGNHALSIDRDVLMLLLWLTVPIIVPFLISQTVARSRGFHPAAAEDTDVFILNQAYFSMAVDYYARGSFETQSLKSGEEAQTMAQLIAGGTQRIWFIQGPWGGTGTRDYLENTFGGAALLLHTSYKGIDIYLYDLRA